MKAYTSTQLAIQKQMAEQDKAKPMSFADPGRPYSAQRVSFDEKENAFTVEDIPPDWMYYQTKGFSAAMNNDVIPDLWSKEPTVAKKAIAEEIKLNISDGEFV